MGRLPEKRPGRNKNRRIVRSSLICNAIILLMLLSASCECWGFGGQLFGGRKRSDGSHLLNAEELRDGIIAFEDENDAERYSALLQAETSAQVKGIP